MTQPTSRKVVYQNGYQPSGEKLLRVGVVGTRQSAPDAYETRVKPTLDKFRGIRNIVIVTGGARGYDQLGMRYAEENHLPCIVFYPLWDELGRKAGYVRNRDIVMESDLIFAWPGIGGAGTQHTVNIAKETRTPVYVTEVERYGA